MEPPSAKALLTTQVFAHSGWESIRVTGPERGTWLSGVLTCDTRDLAVGQAVWGLALDRKGKIQSEVWVLATAEALLCAVSPGRAAMLVEHLDAMLIMEDAELACDDNWTWFECFGPDASSQAAALAGEVGHVGTMKARGATTSSTLVCLPRALAADALGKWRVDPPGDEVAWHRFRLENGLPEFGVDFDQTARPHDASLERLAVSWSKGCYLGQEVVCMQDMRGKVQKHLVVMRTEGTAEVGASVVDSSGAEVGRVRSVAAATDGATALLMVMLRTAHREPLTLPSGQALRLNAEPAQ